MAVVVVELVVEVDDEAVDEETIAAAAVDAFVLIVVMGVILTYGVPIRANCASIELSVNFFWAGSST